MANLLPVKSIINELGAFGKAIILFIETLTKNELDIIGKAKGFVLTPGLPE